MPPGKSTRGHFEEEGPVDWKYYFSMLARHPGPGVPSMYSPDRKNHED